jgi:hypothetical protein
MCKRIISELLDSIDSCCMHLFLPDEGQKGFWRVKELVDSVELKTDF